MAERVNFFIFHKHPAIDNRLLGSYGFREMYMNGKEFDWKQMSVNVLASTAMAYIGFYGLRGLGVKWDASGIGGYALRAPAAP